MKDYRQQITVFSLFILACFLLLPVAYNLSPVFTPASPLYFLKGVREVIELKFAGSLDSRSKLQLEFATRRLKEVSSLLAANQDLIQPTLERYVMHINNLPDKDPENKELGLQIINNLEVHLRTLEQMYYQASSPRTKMAIRFAIDRVSRRADISTAAKLKVCKFFSREASSSALNETERWVLSERARKCGPGSI